MTARSISFFCRPGNGPRAVKAALIAGMLALGACQTAPPPPTITLPPPGPAPAPAPDPIEPFRPDRPPVETGLTPPHMQDRQILRAALLLPFSSNNEAARREAASMLNAAELALFERGGDSLLLIPKDTGGTAAGGEAAARAAVQEGAHVILGPLLAPSVRGAGNVTRARGLPVVAFSTDRTVAGSGIYLLSFAPENEVRRLAGYAAQQGVRSIALLGAEGPLAQRTADTLREIAAQGGPEFHEAALYGADNYNEATFAIERLAAARAQGAFQALFVNDTPAALRELSAVLRANALSGDDVLLLGPDSWRADPSIVTIGALRGALLAGPDQEEQAGFIAAYRRTFGEAPSALASLAYDAVALASQLNGDFGDWDIIENRNGYLGAGGLFRLPPDGVAERGLAVYRLGASGFVLEDRAPSRFDLAF